MLDWGARRSSVPGVWCSGCETLAGRRKRKRLGRWGHRTRSRCLGAGDAVLRTGGARARRNRDAWGFRKLSHRTEVVQSSARVCVRDFTYRAMAPVWEANHVWLIFVLVVTWTAYPTAFGSIASTLAVAFFVEPTNTRSGDCRSIAEAIVRVARLRPTRAIPVLNLGVPACATVRVGSRALNDFLAVRGGTARVLGPGRSPPREDLRQRVPRRSPG